MIYKVLCVLSVASAFVVMLLTAGASDLNAISFNDIVVRLIFAVILLVASKIFENLSIRKGGKK